SHCVHGNARLSGHRTRAAASTQRIARFSALLASGLSEEMGRALAVPPFTRAAPRLAALRRAPRAQLWASSLGCASPRSAVLLCASLCFCALRCASARSAVLLRARLHSDVLELVLLFQCACDAGARGSRLQISVCPTCSSAPSMRFGSRRSHRLGRAARSSLCHPSAPPRIAALVDPAQLL